MYWGIIPEFSSVMDLRLGTVFEVPSHQAAIKRLPIDIGEPDVHLMEEADYYVSDGSKLWIGVAETSRAAWCPNARLQQQCF